MSETPKGKNIYQKTSRKEQGMGLLNTTGFSINRGEL